MRLIDADVLPNYHIEIEDADTHKVYVLDVVPVEVVRSAPTIDAVPVVRCKECNHWNNACCGLGTGDCHVLERITFETFFCSYGERRDDANDTSGA